MRAKLAILLTIVLILGSIIVYATEIQENLEEEKVYKEVETTEETEPVETIGAIEEGENIEEEQPVIISAPVEETAPVSATVSNYIPENPEKIEAFREQLLLRQLYSVKGYVQDDVVNSHFHINNGYKDVLYANGIEGIAVDANNCTYGRIIGICSINPVQLEEMMAKGTYSTDKIKDLLTLEYNRYVEVKYDNILLSLMKINQAERIEDFVSADVLNNAVVKQVLDSVSYDAEIFILAENRYVSGILVNDGDNEFFLRNVDGTYVKNSIEDGLKGIDDLYLLDNPRIDYEAIAEANRLEEEEIAKRNRKLNIITASVVIVAVAALVIIIVVCVKKFISMDDE